MTITTIICTKNRKKDIHECLSCLAKQTVLPSECIVVEDISEHQFLSTQKLQSYFTAKVKCAYFTTTSSQISVSRNIGLKKSSSKIIVYIDDDVIFDPSLIKKIVQLHTKFPKITGFVGKVLPTDNLLLSQFGSWYFSRDMLKKKKMEKVVLYPSSTVSFKKEFLTKNHLKFNEKFGATGEDIEFFYMLHRKGGNLFFHPSITTYHKFRSHLFGWCFRCMQYAQHFTYYADRFPEYFKIEEYFPTRKIHVLGLPFFMIARSWHLTTKDVFYFHLPKYFFFPSFVTHFSHFVGIYSSKEGQQKLGRSLRHIFS